MKTLSTFSFYVIGEDTLTIECIEILLSRNWTCLGVISPVINIQEWANRNGIPYFETLLDAKNSLIKDNFDFLFSIINGSIISDDILKRPRYLSINYHSALLPQYAGLNPASWAILNQEKYHGVTWHVIDSGIDSGNILRQEKIEIQPDETALSLNLKCYEKGIELFKNLVLDLENLNFSSSSQNLKNRNYYGLADKPEGNGWIDWNSSAEDIERLCRACNQGHYINQFTLPKFKIDNEVFIIEKCKVINEKSEATPGTITYISNDSWNIRTRNFEISILEIRSLDKDSHCLEKIAKRHKLKIGTQLNSPKKEEKLLLKKISEEISKNEKTWAKEIKEFKPSHISFISKHKNKKEDKNFTLNKTIRLPESFSKNTKTLFPETELYKIIMAALFIYIYKFENDLNIGVYFSKQDNNDKHNNLMNFLSSYAPFSINIEENSDIRNIIKKIENRINFQIKNKRYFKDIIFRHPEIKNSVNPFVSISITNNHSKNTIFQKESDIAIFISTSGNKISLFFSDNLLKDSNLKYFLKNFKEQFLFLLNSIFNKKEKNINEINTLTKNDYKKIVFAFNNTKTRYPNKKSIIQVFEEQAKKTPNNIAVSYKGFFLTYIKLNEWCNRFSNYLIEKGMTPGNKIVVMTDHDTYLAKGIISALKTNGLYIPIDPSSQEEHIRNILRDSEPKFILTVKKYAEYVKNLISEKCHIINLDINLSLLNKYSNKNIKSSRLNIDSSCIIYTSGTTGKPKGVVTQDKNIIRLVKNTNFIKIKSTDRVAQASTINFDAATLEIWGALLNGASLIEISKDSLLTPTKFYNFLNKEKITILFLTTSLFHQYVSYMPEMFRNLKYLLIGGEVLNPEKISHLLKCEKGIPKHILNGYGPTENTTFTTTHLIHNKDFKKRNIPIGKPISNTTVYILDKKLNPVPIGIIGELYTGGDGVAVGYFNKPELTKEKFISNPFSKNKQDRLYKTGDMARWLPDGSIEYIGRIDKQIKIRGYRIELEGIEKSLLQSGNISQCVVIAKKTENQDNYLVAYLVPQNIRDSMLLPEVKKNIVKLIPEYMIPQFFVVIHAIPLKKNGKVDYEKLPIPDRTKREFQNHYVPPSDKIEEKLCKIWSRLFSLKKISTMDNFFDLGGHSLLLTKLILDVKHNFNFDLNVHHFLKSPTISHLAQIIHSKVDEKIENCTQKVILEDIQWEDYIIPRKRLISSNKKTLFLTGCTGFLGIHLLSYLLNNNDGEIYCLIRADSIPAATNKLKKIKDQYRLNIDFKNRVKILVGDISLPFFGLSRKNFSLLSKKIDAIYHNAAHVNHIYGYERLRAENVLSTMEIIKLATSEKIKEIHYISTLSAAIESIGKDKKFTEDILINQEICPLNDGYNQTKWVSEKILATAYQHGIPVKVYRPGWILGDTQFGIIPPNKNHLLLLIKSCIQMKTAPSWDMDLNIIPVDFLAEAITKISLEPNITENVFNFVNHHSISWKQLITFLNKMGFDISLVPSKKWREQHLAKIDESNALYNLFSLHISPTSEWSDALSKISKISDKNTLEALDIIDLHYPAVNAMLTEKYLRFLMDCGFINNAN